jgi:hypothetical protein
MPNKLQTRPNKNRDYLVYGLIGCLLVLLVWVFAMHQAKTGGSPDLPLKWIGFVGMTSVVFGYTIRANRVSWKKPKFWTLLALFLVLHATGGGLLLATATGVPLLLYAILAPPEYLILAGYLRFFLGSEAN